MKSAKNHAFLLVTALAVGLLPGLLFAANSKGQSGEHRGQIAQIVQQLNSVADKDGGIGPEISQIASAQNTSTEKMVQAMERIENRNRLKTFLIGTDFKNLGAIRSELATTANHIDRLKKALQRTTSTDAVIAELTAQITALENQKSTVETFVKTNESKFSLFGWLVKMFQ